MKPFFFVSLLRCKANTSRNSLVFLAGGLKKLSVEMLSWVTDLQRNHMARQPFEIGIVEWNLFLITSCMTTAIAEGLKFQKLVMGA